VTSFLLLGYLCMGRTFAYLGIPSLHLYIGEIVLGLFFVFGPQTVNGRWIWLPIKTTAFRGYKKLLTIFLIFGIFQVVHGIYAGHSPLLAIRDLAMNYYPLYFPVGLWVGLRDFNYLRRFIRVAAWTNGIYGILYIVILSQIPWSFTGFSQGTDPIQAFGQPSFSAAILLGLICFERNIREVAVVLCLNVFVLLGMLIRAEWLAFGVGLVLWACFSRNLRKLAVAGVLIVGVLAVMYWTNFSYVGPVTRGGTISTTDIVGRILAPVNPDLAKDYTADVQQFEGNAVWRTLFWAELWNTVNDSTTHRLIGLGYGYPLNNLQPFGVDTGTRTPHSVFFWSLSYTGWIGVLIFASVQISLGRLLWLVYRHTGQPFGIVFLVAMIAFASFTPFFEVPQGAIPFYLILGCTCANLFVAENQTALGLTRRPIPWTPLPEGSPVTGSVALGIDRLAASR
ncbi:MAG: O-antigen ligase family protein, partial [Candidatus Acidiferrum sp.]